MAGWDPPRSLPDAVCKRKTSFWCCRLLRNPGWNLRYSSVRGGNSFPRLRGENSALWRKVETTRRNALDAEALCAVARYRGRWQ